MCLAGEKVENGGWRTAIVDPDQESLEIHLLDEDGYRLGVTLQGDNPARVPRFSDLDLAAKEIFI